MSDDAEHWVAAVISDAQARRKLAAALAGELQLERRSTAWRRTRPVLAGLSSAAVILLAFLVPSLQDQWDRYKTRAAIDRYADVGRGLMHDEHYESAEQAYGRALELAGNQRMDLLEGQLRARVMRVYDSNEWRAKANESVTEADFLYLLQLEGRSNNPAEHATTLGAYGAYLAGLKRWSEAEKRLKEAMRADPKATAPHIHVGNLYDDLGRSAEAEAEYRRAIALDPREPNAHYNLGLLLNETKRAAMAEGEFKLAVDLDPQDAADQVALVETLAAEQKMADALAQAIAAQKLLPGNKDIAALVQRLSTDHR